MFARPDHDHDPADTQVESPQALLEIFDSWWVELNRRQRQILEDRTFSARPASLQRLGEDLKLSRQRVQQIEAKCLVDLESVVTRRPVKEWSVAMRTQINPVISLERLLGELPILRELVPGTDIPIWRILAACDDSYEVREEWCAAPNIAVAQTAILNSFHAEKAEAGSVDLLTFRANTPALIGMASRDVVGWLAACGLATLETQVLPLTASIPDRAAAVLTSEGEPLSAQAIHARLGSDRSIRSLKNALGADERFSRVNREVWSLRRWGLSSYSSIRGLIEAEVDLAGGRVGATELVAKLTAQFDVKPTSVLAYASAHPFIIDQGTVRRRRDGEDERVVRSPWETPRLYRRQRDWVFRVRITFDHKRGSGSPIPPALARIIGLAPGGSVALDSEVGEQILSWSGLAPTIGSVRRLLGNISEDDEVAFVFDDAGRFAIELLPKPSNPFEVVLSAAALSPKPSTPPLSVLATSIGQPPNARLTDIVFGLRARGDWELADLLEGL